MIITVRRTGGFAGLDENVARFDTARLAPEAAGSVSARLAEIERLGAAQERLGFDQLRFEIDVQDEDGTSRTLVVIDEGDPHDPLIAQVERLVSLAGVAASAVPE